MPPVTPERIKAASAHLLGQLQERGLIKDSDFSQGGVFAPPHQQYLLRAMDGSLRQHAGSGSSLEQSPADYLLLNTLRRAGGSIELEELQEMVRASVKHEFGLSGLSANPAKWVKQLKPANGKARGS